MAAFSLSAFCGDVGADLLREYCLSRLRCEPPANPETVNRREYGKAAERAIRNWSASRYRTIRGEFQRIEIMSDAAGQDCLRQANPDPGDHRGLLNRFKSARQRALFCFVHKEAIFRVAEGRRIVCAQRQCAGFHDSWTVKADLDPRTLVIPGTFKSSIMPTLKERFGKRVDARIDPHTFEPGFPSRSGEAFQMIIAIKDTLTGLPLWSHFDTIYAYPGIERTCVITYYPKSGQLLICGQGLQRDGRQEVADVFARLVLGMETAGKPLQADSFLLRAALNLEGLILPQKANLISAGFSEIRFRAAGTNKPTVQHLDPGQSILSSVSRSLGQEAARRLRHGNEVNRLKFQFIVRAGPGEAKDVPVTATLTPNGLGVSTYVDAHLAIASRIVDLCGLRSDDQNMPLWMAA